MIFHTYNNKISLKIVANHNPFIGWVMSWMKHLTVSIRTNEATRCFQKNQIAWSDMFENRSVFQTHKGWLKMSRNGNVGKCYAIDWLNLSRIDDVTIIVRDWPTSRSHDKSFSWEFCLQPQWNMYEGQAGIRTVAGLRQKPPAQNSATIWRHRWSFPK